MSTRIIYIPHGGGPLPLLGDAGHADLAAWLRDLGQASARPRAIVVISAHWESPQASLTSAARPSLIYDYSGFPEEAYRLQYPAAGEPDLAMHLHGCITAAGIDCSLDPLRGFDHGLFVPLTLMYPSADIPCLQLSLLSSLDAASHLELGKALSSSLDEDVMVIGSGFSFHNMREFFRPSADADDRNAGFQSWLAATCGDEVPQQEREARLVAWEQAPHARFCHPREEHLLPLHVCAGIAGRAADSIIQLSVLGKLSTAVVWS